MTNHFTQEEARAALEKALGALESLVFNTPYDGKYGDALTAGRAALAQPQVEAVEPDFDPRTDCEKNYHECEDLKICSDCGRCMGA